MDDWFPLVRPRMPPRMAPRMAPRIAHGLRVQISNDPDLPQMDVELRVIVEPATACDYEISGVCDLLVFFRILGGKAENRRMALHSPAMM